MICKIEDSNNGSYISKGITITNILNKGKEHESDYKKVLGKERKRSDKTHTDSGIINTAFIGCSDTEKNHYCHYQQQCDCNGNNNNMERQPLINVNDRDKCKLVESCFENGKIDKNLKLSNHNYANCSNSSHIHKQQVYSNLVNDVRSHSVSNECSYNTRTRYNNATTVNGRYISSDSSHGDFGQIEMRRKYYIKVTPLNTKYIAVVRTITNNTPLLLCFEHGKDRHPKEVINLKNSNVYKGVTEKGPCICIRPKNESKYKTIEIVTDSNSISSVSGNCRKPNSSEIESSRNEIPTKQMSDSGCASKTGCKSTKISSNSVNMYEMECHSDFDLWCNFFASIGITLFNFRSLFHTTKLIGEGSFAKVYKGKNIITGEDIVLKAVDKKKVKESNVYTEIEVLRRVHHPHIVRFIASFEEEDHVCLVLEFLGGGELFEWIAQKGAYTEEQAKIAMKKVLLALQWLHANNVVHRDLKTENLILEHRNCPESLKIIDFGLAASLGSPAMKMRCGSPGYVAPEILEDKIYTTKVDVFSIGVVLYTLLGGSPPFPGSNMKEILKKNIQGNVQFTSSRWKNVSSSVKDLIRWMMAKDPESRCSAAQAIYHPWFESVPSNIGFNKYENQISSFSSQVVSNGQHGYRCSSNVVSGDTVGRTEKSVGISEFVAAASVPTSTVSAVATSSPESHKKATSSCNYRRINKLQSGGETKVDSFACGLLDKLSIDKNAKNVSVGDKKSSTNISCTKEVSNRRLQNKTSNLNGEKNLAMTLSSLEYTDSHLTSSNNSMKTASPRSSLTFKNHSNRKISSLLRSNRNCNADLSQKCVDKQVTGKEEECLNSERRIDGVETSNRNYICDAKSSTLVTARNSNSILNENFSKKTPDESAKVCNRNNLQPIYYGNIEDDNIIFERPVIGNIITSSNNISINTNNNFKNKTNRSSSIKAVIQNVFSRFSSQGSSVSIGRKHDIN